MYWPWHHRNSQCKQKRLGFFDKLTGTNGHFWNWDDDDDESFR